MLWRRTVVADATTATVGSFRHTQSESQWRLRKSKWGHVHAFSNAYVVTVHAGGSSSSSSSCQSGNKNSLNFCKRHLEVVASVWSFLFNSFVANLTLLLFCGFSMLSAFAGLLIQIHIITICNKKRGMCRDKSGFVENFADSSTKERTGNESKLALFTFLFPLEFSQYSSYLTCNPSHPSVEQFSYILCRFFNPLYTPFSNVACRMPHAESLASAAADRYTG